MTTTEPAGVLDPAQIESFHRDGFLVIDRLIDDAAVAELRAAYDAALAATSPDDSDYLLGGVTRQMMLPSWNFPGFADNPAIAAARALTAPMIDDPTLVFDMLIYKPPMHPHETPWHQDMAYAGRPVAAPGTPMPEQRVQVWVALDDVDEENGCMFFVPGRHREPMLEHIVVSDDPDHDRRLLALVDAESQLDLSSAVAAPVRAGGATMHAAGTPHFTSANRSPDRHRRAYIFNLIDRASAPKLSLPDK